MTKISVVEDEKIIALDIKRTLVKFGFVVNAVYSNAESLLSNIDYDLPDLILMDIHLGAGISGIQAASIIRQKYDIPIIFATAYADKKTVDEALKNQPFAYIVKPFTDDTLFTTVNVVLSRAKIEKQLKREKLRFKKLTDLLPLVVFETNGNFELTFLNAFGRKLIGDYNINTKLTDFVKEKTTFENFLNKIKETAISSEIQLSLRILNKKLIPVLFIVDILTDEIGKFVGFRGVAIDFSNMQKLQNQIIELKKLSAISLVISKFKNELTRYLSQGIDIINELINKDSESRVDLEFIKKNMVNARKITDSMALFEIKKVKEEIDINSLILDISRTFVYLLKNTNIKFSCNCNHNLQKIYFNEKALKTSIFLLCDLALEFMKNEDTLIIETQQDKNIKILITIRSGNLFYEEFTLSPTFEMAKNILSYQEAKINIKQKRNNLIIEINIPNSL